MFFIYYKISVQRYVIEFIFSYGFKNKNAPKWGVFVIVDFVL